MEKLRRILIVDGDALLKAGLQALLAEEPDIDVLAETWLHANRARTLPNSPSLSVKTVGKHRANLMAKLDVHNAAGVTAYAIERGLLL